MSTSRLTRNIRSVAKWPLYSVTQTQTIERAASGTLPAHTLMQRAGWATAQLALAIAPHAKKIWVACGPGNNGGDGLEAALHLHAWGKRPVVTALPTQPNTPEDALHALERARAAGLTFVTEIPTEFDLAIDAIFGIGPQRPPEGPLSEWLSALQHTPASVLCVDAPTGLLADTGAWIAGSPAAHHNGQRHTLSLLTLKPGLFTSQGRDASGEVWFNDLGIHTPEPPIAWLQKTVTSPPSKPHNSHKGSFGDVSILGGAPGMSGAAVLAGLAALHGGAGRVLVGIMDPLAQQAAAMTHPALMVRAPSEINPRSSVVVCGCGGGNTIHALLPSVISSARQLVLDADALNALAQDIALQRLLKNRRARGAHTVLTPHPLEAARLLNTCVDSIQSNRLTTAQELAEMFQCIVVLKGSGSIIACPDHIPVLNGSGNAALATAGTGDVLAGLIGAYIAQQSDPWTATCQAVWRHGHTADAWQHPDIPLDAAMLAMSLR